MKNAARSLKKILRLLGALIGSAIFMFLLFWVLNELTGVFTYMHLDHEREMVQRTHDPEMRAELLDELRVDAKSSLMWKRRVAAIQLGKLGGEAADALPTLRVLLDDKDPEVREVASEAIKKVENAPSIKQ